MKKIDVKKREAKTKRLNLRISEEDSKFLGKESLSPQAILNKGIEELKNEK